MKGDMMLKVVGSILVLLSSLLWRCQATELMFELPDRDRQCFYEEIEKGVTCTLEYQVGPVKTELTILFQPQRIRYSN